MRGVRNLHQKNHYFDVHMILQHGPEDEIPCEHCSKTLGCKSKMRKHVMGIHESKMIILDILRDIVTKATK